MKKDFVEITTPLITSDFRLFAGIVNQGIDAHLEAFTRSKFFQRGNRYVFDFHVAELPILVRRLRELDTDDANQWADDIEELPEFQKVSV